jgi:phage-related protein
MVWSNQLADTDAYIEEQYFIDSYISSEDAVEFTLSSKFDVLDIVIPAGTYLRGYCRWKFKSTECAYAGAETSCNKTLARCRVLANQVRFGGFPSIPSDRIYAG